MLPWFTFETVIEEVWEQFTVCVNTVKGESILLLSFGVGFASSIIGLTKRFFSFKN